jgi:hypothetical protein
MPEMSPIKRKYRVQRPDGQIVEFMGSVDMGDDDIEKAGQFQSEIEQQRKSQKMMDAAQKFLPQTNSTLGKLAGGFADFMNTPATPSSEEYFNRISAGTGNEQPAQGFVDQMGQALTGSMLDAVGPFTSPTGLLSMAVPGAGLIKSAAPAAKVASRALPRLFGAAAAPGAVMDINEAYQDPTTENVTRAMGSTGMAGLGLMTGKLPSVRGPGAPPIPPPTAPPGMGAPYQLSAGPQTGPVGPQLPANRLLGAGEPFVQPPQRPFNPPLAEGPYLPLQASSLEQGIIRPGPLPPGMGTPEITGMGVQGNIPPEHPLAIHPRTAGILERAAAEQSYGYDPTLYGQEAPVTFPRANVEPPAPIPFPQRLMEPLPPMPEPVGRTVNRPGEPVMGEEFAKERSSRDERLAPEVLEQARADAASERATKLAPSVQEVPPPLIESPPTPEPPLPEGVTKGEKGALGQMYDVETAQGKTTIAATPETIAQKAEETRRSFEAKPAVPEPPVVQYTPVAEVPQVQTATRTVKRGKPTPIVERPAQGVTAEGPIQPRTIGNFTIEASGDPKLPYQLREGDTVMSKGLKPDSFDAYVKRRQKEAAEQKAIEDKYRDVDEEIQPSDIPEGFQEVIPEEVAPPTEAERAAMGVKPKRVVNRAPKKKDNFPLAKKRPGEAGFARLAGEEEKAGKGPSDVTKGMQDLFKPITDAVAKLGPAGKEIARLMTRARLVGEHYAGTWESRAKDALSAISDEEFGAIVKGGKVLRGNLIDVLEGKAEPRNERIAQAAAQIKQLLDETGTKGEQSGMTMEGGKQPNYFPHLYTEEFWGRIKRDPNFKNNILERMVKQNPGMTMNEASNILQRSRQFGERLISPQHERVFNLPGWERSKGALMKHLHDMGRQIANAEEIGPKDIAGDKLNKLIKDTTDPEYAYELLKRAMKRDEPPPIRDVKAVQKITTGASWAYLSRAAIGNLSQLTRVPLHTSFANTAKAFRQYLTDRQGFYREGLNSGAIVEIGAKGLMEEFGSKSKSYKVYGIESSEKFLRSVASAAGRSEAEASFRVLKNDPTNKAARVQLEDLLQENVDTVLKQENLTGKQSAVAGGRAAELTQGRAEAMDLPKKWSGSPYANLYFLYKKYALQDFRNMAKAVQKNPVKSLATIAVLNQAAGEFVGDAKEILKGLGVGLVKGDTAETIEQKLKDRGTYISKDNPLLGRILDNYLQSYTFGILADAAQNIKKGRYAGTIGEMVGDVTSTVVATGQRIAEGKERPGTPILKTATSMVPFIGPGLREGLFAKEPPKRKGPPRRVLRAPRRSQPSP